MWLRRFILPGTGRGTATRSGVVEGERRKRYGCFGAIPGAAIG